MLPTTNTHTTPARCSDAPQTKYQSSPLPLVQECRGSAPIGPEDHDVATPALLCHKQAARHIQSSLQGTLDRKIAPLIGVYYACSSMVLHGIKELAPAIPRI